MSRAEDDDIEQTMAAQRAAEVERQGKTITGHEAALLRTAIATAARVLGRINPRGLGFADAREMEHARRLLAEAQAIVHQPLRPRAATASPDPPRPPTTGRSG